MLGNVISFIILAIFIVLFAWLTRRSWRSRHKLLKWLAVVPAALLTMLASLLLILMLVGLYKLNEQHPNPVADIHVTGTPAQVARGEKLANICTSCHSPDSKLPLSGVDFAAKFGGPPLGTFYAPNLTPSGNIRDWSDGEVVRAIREGIHKDGRSLVIMPAENFRNLSDEDVQALVAYLRSQPPTNRPTPDNEFSLPGALMVMLFDLDMAQPPITHVSAPPPGTPEYGKYMVDIIGCRSCHGAQLQGKQDTGQPGPPPGPNLTQIVPKWSEAQFMTFFNTGTLPGGQTVPVETLPSGFSEPRMPWTEVRAVASDDELRAIFSYLHSLQPIESASR